MAVRLPGDFDVGILGNMKKDVKELEWDVHNVESWKTNRKDDMNNMEISDRLYKQTEGQIDLELMKRRMRVQKGEQRKKSIA